MARRVRGMQCSFCGKRQTQVQRLIAGPGVYICDECIGLCNEILHEAPSTWTASTHATSHPTNIGRNGVPWWQRVLRGWWQHDLSPRLGIALHTAV